jgi:hypothetical protein
MALIRNGGLIALSSFVRGDARFASYEIAGRSPQ